MTKVGTVVSGSASCAAASRDNPPESVTLPEVPEDDLEDIPEAGVKMAKPQGDHATMLKTGNWPSFYHLHGLSLAPEMSACLRHFEADYAGRSSNAYRKVGWKLP